MLKTAGYARVVYYCILIRDIFPGILSVNMPYKSCPVIVWFPLYFIIPVLSAYLLERKTISNQLEFRNCSIVRISFGNFYSSRDSEENFKLRDTASPRIISNGSSSISKTHHRKHVFCIVYIILFPETFEFYTTIINYKYWPEMLLEKVGIRVRNRGAEEIAKRVVQTTLLERHYMIVVTKLKELNEVGDYSVMDNSEICKSVLYKCRGVNYTAGTRIGRIFRNAFSHNLYPHRKR